MIGLCHFIETKTKLKHNDLQASFFARTSKPKESCYPVLAFIEDPLRNVKVITFMGSHQHWRCLLLCLNERRKPVFLGMRFRWRSFVSLQFLCKSVDALISSMFFTFLANHTDQVFDGLHDLFNSASEFLMIKACILFQSCWSDPQWMTPPSKYWHWSFRWSHPNGTYFHGRNCL